MALADCFDAGRLAGEAAEIIEPCPPDLATSQHLDFLQTRRMKRKNPFDSDALRNLAHGKSRTVTATINLDYNTFKRLDPFLFAFNYPHLQPQRIANPELGDILAQTTFFDFLDNAVHRKPTPEQWSIQIYPKPALNSIPVKKRGQKANSGRKNEPLVSFPPFSYLRGSRSPFL